MGKRQGGLTLKQVLFTEFYLGEAKGNGTLAAKMAGYKGDDNTLGVEASQLLDHPEIKARVGERVDVAGGSTDAILAELAAIAFAPWGSSLVEVTNRHGVVIEAKLVLADKIKALELLGRYHNLWTDKTEVTVVQKALIGVDLDRI